MFYCIKLPYMYQHGVASQWLSVKQAVDSDGGRLHLISLFREDSEALSGTAGGRPLHEATAF